MWMIGMMGVTSVIQTHASQQTSTMRSLGRETRWGSAWPHCLCHRWAWALHCIFPEGSVGLDDLGPAYLFCHHSFGRSGRKERAGHNMAGTLIGIATSLHGGCHEPLPLRVTILFLAHLLFFCPSHPHSQYTSHSQTKHIPSQT